MCLKKHFITNGTTVEGVLRRQGIKPELLTEYEIVSALNNLSETLLWTMDPNKSYREEEDKLLWTLAYLCKTKKSMARPGTPKTCYLKMVIVSLLLYFLKYRDTRPVTKRKDKSRCHSITKIRKRN